MYNFEEYLDNKSQLIARIDSVENKFRELESFGIEINEFIRKLENAKKSVSGDKISVVLVGAFSDGKTSVAAGWINEKLDNMKIDSDESSDEILCYTPSSIPDGCQIVDTPGLFGDKVGNDDNGMSITLSDKTKKYISEANLILYVVPAKNPIKDSHKECVKWILKDLNKLSSTIFVINRMDDVADLTDEADFSQQAKIKTDVVRQKLLDCGLSASEAQQAKIVCISAAPNGKDIEIWRAHRDEYLKRSHFSSLEQVTNSILTDSKSALVAKTGCDILNNEISKVFDILSEQENEIENIIIPEQKESLKRNKRDLEDLRKRILRSRADMKEELHSLEKRKISVIRSATMENFKEIMEDEIGLIPGNEGSILNDEIVSIFQKYVDNFQSQIIEVGNKFQAEYDKQNEAINAMLKKGADAASIGLKNAGAIGVQGFKAGIFAARDLLGKIGIVIKFKPWQVTKIANFCTKAIPIIGAIIDVAGNVIENLTEQKRNKQFEHNKDEIKTAISEAFNDIKNTLNDNDKFFAEFAPQFTILEQQIQQDEKTIEEHSQLIENFRKWKKHAVDAEFSIF